MTKFLDSMKILRLGETKVTRENLYGAKRPINTWNVNFDNSVISKLLETKSNYKYLIGYLDAVIRTLFLTKWVHVLRHFKLKMKIMIKTINWCLSVQMMRSY